jgi:uroporphyrinogen-III decarboxylase
LRKKEGDMARLTSRERILKTINGEEVDRLPVYDIIHNVELIEHLTEDKITPQNAEELTCKAANKVLDLVRHFTVPVNLEPQIITDEDGFVYSQEWWTKTILERPIKTVEETRELMKKDVERIYRAIEKQEVCHQALEQLELLGEHCKTFEEVKVLFKRIADKLEDTVMVAPESLPGMYTATNRYGFELFIYAFYDYPEDTLALYKALGDYEVARIHSFADLDLTPVALLSEELASNSGLLFRPDFIKEVIYPNIKKVIDAWKSHGYKVIFHSDGNKWLVLDDIISFGADVIDPCESLASMEVKKFKELYPDTTIASPIDCQNLLTSGTKEEVAEACWKLIEDANDERVLLGSTSEIHPSVPVENAMTMYDLLRNY